MLTTSTDFTLSMSNELGSAAGARPGILVYNCGVLELNLLWLLPGQEVSYGICDILGTLSRYSICSPNVVCAGAFEWSSNDSWTTAGTLHSVVLYFLSLSQNQSAASSHPCCGNSSSFICFCRNLIIHCCTLLVIGPITMLVSSSLLSCPCSVSESSLSSRSSPSSELARSLRLSMIAPSSPEMFFRALYSCVWRFQLSLYHPVLAAPLPLRLPLAFLPLQFLFPHNPRCIILSLYCLKRRFLVISRLQASFWIACCAMPQGLGLFQLPSCSCLHLLDEAVGLTALLIGLSSTLEVAKYSSSEYQLLQYALTLLLREMLDVARYGQYWGKLHLLCQGWYIYSSWRKQNLLFDCQFNGNS